jgi:hypothetical protein
VNDWIQSIGNSNKEEVSSIAGGDNQSDKIDSLKQGSQNETLTQLGSSYKIKDVTVSKSSNRSFPIALLALVVIAPLLFVFAMGILSTGGGEEENRAFLFETLESDYFTLTVDPDYSVDSVTNKKVPFLERHILTNTKDGQKTITIMVKDVKFDYDVNDNLGAKARKSEPQTYREDTVEIQGRKGLYYKKTEENFEHFVLLVDRDKSILYEITMQSPTTFATDLELGDEFLSVLNKITFLE